MKCIIYCHTNKINKKSYIGWTVVRETSVYAAMMRRWRDHLSDVRCGSQRYFHNAIRKWGSTDEIWDHNILDVVNTPVTAKHVETLWITQRHTFAYDAQSRGYNETLGGEGTVGYIPSETTRKILSEKSTKSWENSSYRKHIESVLASTLSSTSAIINRSIGQQKRWREDPSLRAAAQERAAQRKRKGGRFIKGT